MNNDILRVVLNSGDVKIDADPSVIASLFHNLINNKEYREVFERDPVSCLGECGIEVPDEVARDISSDKIDAALSAAIEGSEERVAALVAPGVAPAIRVGTRPGTRPGVSIGVRVATGSSTFAVADPTRVEKMNIHEVMEEKGGTRKK